MNAFNGSKAVRESEERNYTPTHGGSDHCDWGVAENDRKCERGQPETDTSDVNHLNSKHEQITADARHSKVAVRDERNQSVSIYIDNKKKFSYKFKIMNEMAAKFHAIADDALRSGLSIDEFKKAIKDKLTAKAQAAQATTACAVEPSAATEETTQHAVPSVVPGGEDPLTEEAYQAAAQQCVQHLRELAATSGKPETAVIKDVAELILKPQPKPDHLKWGVDNLPDEHPATFAVRAYAAEYEAGRLTTDLIREEDKDLAIRLYSAKRSKTWPKGIDIPTSREWNTRHVGKRGEKAEPVKPVVIVLNPEEVRLANVARYRAAHM